MTYCHCGSVVANTRHRFTDCFDDHASCGFFQCMDTHLYNCAKFSYSWSCVRRLRKQKSIT